MNSRVFKSSRVSAVLAVGELWFTGGDCPVRHLVERIGAGGVLTARKLKALRVGLYLKFTSSRSRLSLRELGWSAADGSAVCLWEAVIYLELYFARAALDDERFARNFLIMVEGAVQDELREYRKEIEAFDPRLIFPGLVGGQMRGSLCFAILYDGEGSERYGVGIPQPNARRIAFHQLFAALDGLVILAGDKSDGFDKVVDPLSS